MIGTNAETKIDRNYLIEQLNEYSPSDDEVSFISQFLSLLKSDRCFYRDHFEPGHITGSGILFNVAGDQILMNFHKGLDKWLNFGGHCDGDEDVLAVAIRETMEESGITSLKPITADIIDIDIHTIPANDQKDESAHKHFDIRYVMQMTHMQDFQISDESLELKWMIIDDAIKHSDESLQRFINKAIKAL